jgi:predicted Holliday junction resolvase-like endonuclease
MKIILAFVPMFLLSGCVASLVKDVVTAPIKVVSKTADVMTTSQSEADEKRGRDVRKQEEKVGKLSRERTKMARKCEDGDRDACARADAIEEEIEDLKYR